MAKRPLLRRVLAWSGGLLAAATALTIAIHLGPVRKMLGWKPLGDQTGGTSSGWCPFGFGHTAADGTVVYTPRVRPHNAPDPTKTAAIGRPALGFTLDVSTRADVTAWAAKYSIACTPISGGSTLECKSIPAAALPADENALPVDVAWFNFPFDDKLEIVKTTRRAPDANAIVAALDAQQAVLTAKAGAPAVRDGDATAADLAKGALRQAHAEWQFQNYRATLRATNLGQRGFAMTEMYAAVL